MELIKLAVMCFALAGCVTSPGISTMTPEQLHAMSQPRSCTAVCSTIEGKVVGTSKFVFASCDQTSASAVSVDANCVTTITTNPSLTK